MDAFKFESVISNDLSFLAVIFCVIFLTSSLRYIILKVRKDNYTFLQILMSSMVVALIIFFASDFFQEYLSSKAIFLVPAFTGFVLMDIVKKLSTAKGIKGILLYIIDLLQMFVKK